MSRCPLGCGCAKHKLPNRIEHADQVEHRLATMPVPRRITPSTPDEQLTTRQLHKREQARKAKDHSAAGGQNNKRNREKPKLVITPEYALQTVRRLWAEVNEPVQPSAPEATHNASERLSEDVSMP